MRIGRLKKSVRAAGDDCRLFTVRRKDAERIAVRLRVGIGGGIDG